MNNRKYSKVNTPEELLEFMATLDYGYITDKDKVIKYNDKDFDKHLENYILEDYLDVLKYKVGTCWDQVELERNWFEKHNYEFKTFYIMLNLNYENNYPTHTFLAYKEKNVWKYFENADYNNKGIYTFDSLKDLIKYRVLKQIELYNDMKYSADLKDIIIKEYNKPKKHVKSLDFINNIIEYGKDYKI